MPFRSVVTETFDARTRAGTLRAAFAPDRAELRLGDRCVQLAGRDLVARAGAASWTARIAGLFVARHRVRPELAVWAQLDVGGAAAVRRVFAAAPETASATRELESIAAHLHASCRSVAVARAIELGDGPDRDRVLVEVLADRCRVYQRRLFRGEIRLALTVFADGRVAFAHGAEIQLAEVLARRTHVAGARRASARSALEEVLVASHEAVSALHLRRTRWTGSSSA